MNDPAVRKAPSAKRARSPRLRRLLSKKTAMKWLLALFRTVFIVGICFTILYPLLTKISMSFMDETDLYDRTVKVLAKHFTPQNYLEAATYIDYGRLLLNTVGLCTVVSVLQAMSCTVIGYGFARFHFRGRGLFFALVVLCMVVPTQVILTPQYLNFKSLGMLGSFAPFIALGITGVAPRCGLYIFLARQFFRGIPKEIDEAAAIDGAGPYKTFSHIMLRSALPIMVTIFLFSFVWQWGENTYTNLFYSNFQTIAKTLDSLGYTLADIQQSGSGVVSLAAQMAYQSILRATATLLAIIPLLILYVFCQKFFIQSVERTGIVG